MNYFDLDEWSRDVLWQICHAGPYYSSVVIAVDLYDLGKISNRGEAWLLVEECLRELNERGLVIYSHTHHHEPFTRVRATPSGFTAMGFPPPVKIVGSTHSSGSNASDHPGDPTDWRNHKPWAKGGEIERMSLRDHIFHYWDHAEKHFEQLWEIEKE